MRQRRCLRAEGTVQGVGFRPFVYRLATDEGLTGFVLNDGGGVSIDVQGREERVERFVERLRAELPPSARIARLTSREAPLVLEATGFIIATSAASTGSRSSLAADSAICHDCLGELADPRNRRFGHAFITCTQCGPRYTIVRALPYDRQSTTLASFAMCTACRDEYEAPADRRHHAQPIACLSCGPRLWIVEVPHRAGADCSVDADRGADSNCAAEATTTGLVRPRFDGDTIARGLLAPAVRNDAVALERARTLLAEGRLLALKGLGGFHLAVDANNAAAVTRLRAAKHRARQPFAVMVRDLTVAHRFVALDDQAVALLTGPIAPIVLAPAHRSSATLAPGLADLGVMLPYTPLHQLLFTDGLEALVMTSGNTPGEPIVKDNEEALTLLGADAFVLHDRDIEVACDDSVVRTPVPTPATNGKPALGVPIDRSPGASVGASAVAPVAGSGVAPIIIRRARGHVPSALDATFLPSHRLLGLGAEQKVTLTTLREGELVVGRHQGDLDNSRAEQAYRRELTRLLRFSALEPEAVACDAHPDLVSTALARERFAALPCVHVQHHHAHMAAVMVEHGLAPTAKVCGVVLDGLGYGADGAIWGGEVLRGSYAKCERVAHLRYVPQPGGDRAAREPSRMATSLLWDAGIVEPHEAGVDAAAWRVEVAQICGVRSVSPLTSSAGRLFDGVAALLGVAPATQDYEGEAAALLESLALSSCRDSYPLPLSGDELDTRALIQALTSDRAPREVRAARFHNGLADGFADAALASGCSTIVLAGGCMVNRLLVRRLATRIAAAGVRVLLPQQLPAGDGALSAGQVAVAACRLS